MTHPIRLRTLLATCFLTALFLAPAAVAQPDECKGAAAAVVKVMIDAEKTISVDKDTVTIKRRGRVCWEIDGLSEGETLTMAGKSGSDDQFSDKSVSLPRSFMNSGIANRPGTFRYDLILTDAEGKELYKLDPSVVIGPGG